MRIAYDLDDTIIVYSPEILDYYNRHNGTRFTLKDLADYHLHIMWGCTREEADQWVSRFVHEEAYKQVPPIPGAIEALRRLSARHEQFALTARWTDNREEMTNGFFNRFPPSVMPSDRIFYTSEAGNLNSYVDKSVVCLREGFELIVDDRYTYIETCAAVGIKTILFQPEEYRWNQLPHEFPPLVKRARSWEETEEKIEEYEKIELITQSR